MEAEFNIMDEQKHFFFEEDGQAISCKYLRNHCEINDIIDSEDEKLIPRFIEIVNESYISKRMCHVFILDACGYLSQKPRKINFILKLTRKFIKIFPEFGNVFCYIIKMTRKIDTIAIIVTYWYFNMCIIEGLFIAPLLLDDETINRLSINYSDDEIMKTYRNGLGYNVGYTDFLHDDIKEFLKRTIDPLFEVNNTVKLFICPLTGTVEMSYIEFAALLGAKEIFKYLMLKQAKICDKVFFAAVRSENMEIIHICEEVVKPYEGAIVMAIQSGNREIEDWLIETKVEKVKSNDIIKYISVAYGYHNFYSFFILSKIANSFRGIDELSYTNMFRYFSSFPVPIIVFCLFHPEQFNPNAVFCALNKQLPEVVEAVQKIIAPQKSWRIITSEARKYPRVADSKVAFN